MDMQQDIERIAYLDYARLAAEATYIKNPLDADNLTQWGSALLELSQCKSPNESKLMLQDGISKLEEALMINPKKHDTLWVRGNAHISAGFMTPDNSEARDHFERASHFFQRALDEQPGNKLYVKSLDLASKAPELHAEAFTHGLGPQPLGGVAGPSSTGSKTMKKKNSDFKYDVLGWVILAAGIVTWIRFANSQMQVPKQ